jgi:uncharacterized protein YegL
MAKPNPEFAINPDPRCACVLLLDTSSSMSGPPIDSLNDGLKAFQQDLQEDALASRRVEIAIVTFGKGGCQTLQEFTSAGQFAAPTLEADGSTPMGEAINIALDLVKERKKTYKDNGVLYYQPWIFLITDGAPNAGSPWREAAQRVQTEMNAKALTCFGVGVAGADMQVLSQITPRTVKLDGLKFRELFVWLSQSQKRVAGSKDGQTALPKIGFGSPV